MKRFTGRVDGQGLHGSEAPEQHGALQLLWCGYIANRGELLAEAKRRDESARDCGDGELFAMAYRWWNDDLQKHVVGQYSLGVYDPAHRTLLLTHDSLGLSSLFYSEGAKQFDFGSHLADLVGRLDDRPLDEEYLADYIATGAFLGQRTPYRNIRRLGVGQTLVWRNGRLSQRQTWSPSDITPLRLADACDYEERFRDLLSEAVAAALQAEGPVWSELSGGLDSSSVTCTAAQLGAENLAAFSIVFRRYQRADETGWIQAVLDQYSLPWHAINGDEHLPFGRLPDRLCGEPRFSMINWGWLRRRETLLAENNVAALLTGQGGDLVCLGPGSAPYPLADLPTWRPWHGLAELRRWRQADRQKRSLLYWLVNFVVRPKLCHALRRPVLRREDLNPSPWIHPSFAQRMQLQQRDRQLSVTRCRQVGRQWFWEGLCSMSAQIASQNQDPLGFELRHPFMHRPLVEFVLAVPWQQQLHPGADRLLQRRALAGILPEKVRRRRSKTIFDQPTFEGLRQGEAWTRILTDNPRIAQLGIVEGKKWTKAVSQARMGLTHNVQQFIAASTLEFWLRQVEELDRHGHPAEAKSGPMHCNRIDSIDALAS